MSRLGSTLVVLLAIALPASDPGSVRAQTRPPVPDPAATAAPSLAFPRSELSFPTTRATDDRGIEDATPGVWIGGAAGIVAGGLIGSWAFCGLGEGDCEFSITAAGPGMLIGGILGASIGGLLDREPRAVSEDAYDEELAAVYREELRAYKREQEAIDEETRRTAEALTGSEAFLRALADLRAGVIVVDRDLRVLAWNRASEELWGISADEAIGASLEELEFGLPVAEIRDEIAASADGRIDGVERGVEAVDRRGEPIDLRVRIVPFEHDDGRRHGAVLLVDEA